MLANFKARQRHQRLMRAAHHLLRGAFLAYPFKPRTVTADDFTAYVFGRHQIDLTPADAQRYLEAARVSRGDEKVQQEPTTPIHHSA